MAAQPGVGASEKEKGGEINSKLYFLSHTYHNDI